METGYNSLRDGIFQYLVSMQQKAFQLRMNHWQTTSFAEHKATDGFIDAMYEFIDRMAESTMGQFGRPRINTMNMSVSDRNITSTKWTVEAINAETNTLIEELKTTEFEALLVIAGDFDVEVKKMLYLITLE